MVRDQFRKGVDSEESFELSVGPNPLPPNPRPETPKLETPKPETPKSETLNPKS